MSGRALHVRRLGRVEYEDGLAMQRLVAEARAAGIGADTLLLLEHPRVITLGRAAKEGNVLWNAAQLEAQGFTLHETDRGGDVTYHGPGQIVGYPILDLAPDRKDVRRYVRSVEELMIRAARDHGVIAERVDGRAGIWVRSGPFGGAGDPQRAVEHAGDAVHRGGWEKLGAIGVHLSRWITTHGFAFNVTTRLADFGAIVPCGIHDAGVCSLESRLAREGLPAPSMAEVEERLAQHAAEVWESEAFEVPIELRTISVTVVREGLHGDEVLLLRRVPERGGFWQTLTGRLEREESPLAAAARELFEETGFSPRLEELHDLDYTHAFALDPARVGAAALSGGALAGHGAALPGRGASAPDGQGPARAPIFCRETAFALRVEPGAEPRLDPREHDALRWLPLEDALALLPFAGLRRAAKLAAQRLAPTRG